MGWREVEFAGSDSFERVQRLQQLCGGGGGGTSKSAVNALLLIGGVDSFHSTISQAVLKFLFLGSSGQELLGEQVISQQHERLEDVVLLITAQRAAIFYSSEGDAAVKILPMIARWRNVQELTFHDAMDPDEQEARKIRAFKAMVSGIKRIGIPYGLDKKSGADLQDPMIPEKWPLIQSYGLENEGDGAGTSHKGFFTMNHEVVNVSSRLRDLMLEMDTFSAKRVALEVEPLLMHHYNQFLLKLDHAESPEARNAKCETEMGEDLLSFYEFGTMQYESRGLEVLPTRGSRVLFGTRTSLLGNQSSGSVFLKDAGVKGASAFPATHMLVQVEDPFSGVRFTRTYFLSTGKVCSRIVDEDALVHPPSEQLEQHADLQSNATDTQLLIELYVLLLRGFKSAIRELVADNKVSSSLQQRIEKVKATAIRAMIDNSKSQSHNVLQELLPSFLSDNLVLHAECLDARGLATDFRANEINLLYVSLSLAKVPSKLVPSESLGSLIVGDSILLKPTTTKLKHSATTAKEPFISVTESFPYFRSWVHSGQEADFVRALMATLRSEFMLQSPAIQLGHAVATLDAMVDDAPSSNSSSATGGGGQGLDSQATAQVALTKAVMLLNCDELPSVSGTMRLFSGGFVFLTPHMNPILVSFAKHVRSFRVVPSQFEELVLLQIDLKPDPHSNATPVSESLPFSFLSQELFIPLLSGSRFQEEILRVLNNTWKSSAEALEIPFYRPRDLGLAFDSNTTPRDNEDDDDHNYNAESLPLTVRRTCKSLVKNQRGAGSGSTSGPQSNATALKLAADEFFPKWFIPKDASPVTTLGKPKAQDLSKLCVPITVMLGIPGSDVVEISKSVCEFSSAANDWVHIVVDARDARVRNTDGELYEQYTFKQVQFKLVKTLAHIKANVNPLLHPRIMLAVVGYVDPITVASAIKRVASSPSPPPLQMKLSLLVACVSATNVYLPDPLAAQCPFPKLFDQLTAGFTTHVVVTHSSEISTSQLGRLRFHIDQANQFADIQVLSQDVFEGPITSLLTVDRFESAYYVNYREAHFPGWDAQDAGGVSPYVAELLSNDTCQMPETLRFEVAPGMERSRFLHLVGSTLTPFAVFSKALEKMYPNENPGKTKGIRIAQALAADKVRAKNNSNSNSNHSSLKMNSGADSNVSSYRQQAHSDAEELEFGSRCWGVEGRVTFASDPGCVYRYVSTGISARMRLEPKKDVMGATSQQDEKNCDDGHDDTNALSLELQITGVDLNAAKLHDLLLNCYAHIERSVAPLRSKGSVTIEEKRAIQKEHAMDPLPEGFLYDGSTYVDFFGGRYEFHPNIAQFVDEHIAAANESTKRANVKAEESRRAQQAFVKRVC